MLSLEVAVGKTARKQSVGKDDPRGDTRLAGAESESGAGRRKMGKYIAEMTLELSAMARKADMAFLSYLLELAAEEAAAQSRRV